MAIEIDAETELKLLENSMRDVIQIVLKNKFGPQWLNNLKVSPERVERWRERLETEKKSSLARRLTVDCSTIQIFMISIQS